MSRLLLLGLAGVALAGCKLSAAPPATDLSGDKTWSGVIGPLVLQRCATCHRFGDIGPFPLETYEQVVAMQPAVLSAVREGRMPPFPPEQSDESGCPQIEDVRRMTADERAALVDWLESGAPQGEPRALPPAKAWEPLGPPSDTFKMVTAYASKSETVDDYRCFIIDPVLLTNYPVAALSALPGNRSVVHHASVYLVPAGGLGAVQKLDDAEEGPGYTCFGGAGVANAIPAGVWVPGNDAPLVPTHTALGYYLPMGWTFILQVHYNFAAGRGADQSSIVAWKTQSPVITEVPRALVAGNMDFVIPPGAMGFSAEGEGKFLRMAEASDDPYSAVEGKVYAVWAHQHLKGRSFQMDLERPDGSTQCLLKIPRWDFAWQSIYRLKDPVAAKPGDKLKVKCTWDNPGDTAVGYGEDTNDEMCFGSVALINP
jgi:mono/diheme cytochrome c family protein